MFSERTWQIPCYAILHRLRRFQQIDRGVMFLVVVPLSSKLHPVSPSAVPSAIDAISMASPV